MKIAIIGAGSTYTPELIEGFIKRRDSFPISEISLMDIDERKLGIVGGLARRMLCFGRYDCAVKLTDDPDKALDGASFVFVQIRVGKLPARVLDERIPHKFNLLGQETTGIGGFFKALRTIPVLMDISGRMSRLCPDAFMINFSNPSGINAQAILSHTKIKMAGLCNGPIGMAGIPQKALGICGAEIDYVGLNHLSFITSIRLDGRDYLYEAVNGNEDLLEKLDGINGFSKEDIRLAEAIPIYYLHYYFHQRKAIEKALVENTTRGEECMKIEEELLTLYLDENLREKPALLEKRGGAMYSEAAVSLAESIYLDSGDIHIVNTLNKGAIPFMENDDVVETRAEARKDGITPIPAIVCGNPIIRNIMCAVKTYERYTVKAALSGNPNDALRALMANPLVQDIDAAKACFNEMLAAHNEYLPIFSIKPEGLDFS